MIRGKPTVNNFLKIKDTVQKFSNHVVKIGLPIGTSDTYENGMTVIQVGAVHEYGSLDGTTPQRSFLRVPMYTNRDKIKKMIFNEYTKVINNKSEVMPALHRLGAYGEGISKASFRKNDWEPIKASSQKRKGDSKTTTLVDTGQLRQSITSVVEKI